MDAAPSIRVFDEIHELQEMVLRASRGEELGEAMLCNSSLASPANVRAALGKPREDFIAAAAKGIVRLDFSFSLELEKELQGLCREAEELMDVERAKWDLRWVSLWFPCSLILCLHPLRSPHTHNNSIHTIKNCGSQRIRKEMRVSPDAFFQAVMQLAYAKRHGAAGRYPVSTYEVRHSFLLLCFAFSRSFLGLRPVG